MVGSKACLCIGKALYAPTILRYFSYPSGIGLAASTLPHHYVDGMSFGYGFGIPTSAVVVGYSGRLYLASLPFGLTGAYSVGVHRPFNLPRLYGHSGRPGAGYREGRYLAAYSSNPPRSSLIQRCSLPCPFPGSQPETGTPGQGIRLVLDAYPTVKVQASRKASVASMTQKGLYMILGGGRDRCRGGGGGVG